jgi:hypothetical protein
MKVWAASADAAAQLVEAIASQVGTERGSFGDYAA